MQIFQLNRPISDQKIYNINVFFEFQVGTYNNIILCKLKVPNIT